MIKNILKGFKLAIEINKSAKNTTLKDFKERMSEADIKAKIGELKEKVENFAVKYPMPGLDDY